MDIDVPLVTALDVESADAQRAGILRRFLLGASEQASLHNAPKWILSIWDHKHAIEPAMLRVPLVVFSFLFLWSVNVYFLERSLIPYHSTISVKSINAFSVFIRSLVALGTYGLVITIANMSHFQLEQSILSFYILLVLCVMMPFLPGLDYRNHFSKVMRLVLLPMPNSLFLASGGSSLNGSASRELLSKSPTHGMVDEHSKNFDEGPTIAVIPFCEVLLADALCSLAKVVKDLGTTIVALYAYLVGAEVTGYHYPGMVVVALLASVPFM